MTALTARCRDTGTPMLSQVSCQLLPLEPCAAWWLQFLSIHHSSLFGYAHSGSTCLIISLPIPMHISHRFLSSLNNDSWNASLGKSPFTLAPSQWPVWSLTFVKSAKGAAHGQKLFSPFRRLCNWLGNLENRRGVEMKHVKHSKIEKQRDCFWRVVKLPGSVSSMEKLMTSSLRKAASFFAIKKLSQDHKQPSSSPPGSSFLWPSLTHCKMLSLLGLIYLPCYTDGMMLSLTSC